jgi:predicted enzyme related to lactoylglutathione lyase
VLRPLLPLPLAGEGWGEGDGSPGSAENSIEWRPRSHRAAALGAMQISAVRLFARELAPCLPFYRDRLGLKLRAGSAADGYLVFDGGAGVELIVEAVDADAPADEQALLARFTGLSLLVADIEREYTRLVAAGVPNHGAPEQQFWGGWLLTIEDPAGNQLQLVQRPR